MATPSQTCKALVMRGPRVRVSRGPRINSGRYQPISHDVRRAPAASPSSLPTAFVGWVERSETHQKLKFTMRQRGSEVWRRALLSLPRCLVAVFFNDGLCAAQPILHASLALGHRSRSLGSSTSRNESPNKLMPN